MPYISGEDKQKYEPALSELRKLIDLDSKKGELTYLVYCLGMEWFKDRESYTNISTAISCLDDAKEELRRRYLNPYEDKKLIENGEVT
jgi:hypothetical protein